VYVWAEVV
jgi:hypothetical protein